MENHGVAAARLSAEPTPGTFTVQKMWDKNQQKVINYVIPVIAIGLVYFATQLASKWKVSDCCWNTFRKYLQWQWHLEWAVLPAACWTCH